MTFILAQRFGQRILLLADTKISDPSGGTRRGKNLVHAHNYVPGRLKIFPITLALSIGYAGNSGKALNDLRALYTRMRKQPSLQECLHALRVSSADYEVDYLVVSHIDGPEIFKVSGGRVAFGQSTQWIGDGSVVPLLQSAIRRARQMRETSGLVWSLDAEFGTSEEHDLSAAWQNLLLSAPTLTQSVGGIPMKVLGSPYGHSFLMSAGAYNPNSFIISVDGVTDEVGRPANPLNSQYSYSLVDSAERGAPVIGLWLKEARSAYLYDPIVQDEAIIVSEDYDQLPKLVKARAIELGGCVIDLSPL